MSTIAGRWALTMRTPIGSISAEMTFVERDGIITGTATGKGDTVPLSEVRSITTEDGERVTWSQSITKPMRLSLVFDVIVQGDTMQGHSRAGHLPRSAVSGARQSN